MARFAWFFYSVTIWLLARIAQGLAYFQPALATQLAGRWWTRQKWHELASWSQAQQKKAVIFCSSAGEYEQAKPLIRRLEADFAFGVKVLIFSQSGIRFAQAQNESYFISKSPWDLLWVWRRFFSLVQPDFTMIIRHEIWPGFLQIAREKGGKLFLVDAVASPEQKSGLNQRWKSHLYSYFEKIFVVSAEDGRRLTEGYACPRDQIVLAGDTKYDRVMERIEERQQRSQKLKIHLDSAWIRRRRLIIGSAWPADVSLVLKAYCDSPLLRQDWQVMIAPHEVKPSMIECLVAECQRFGLSYRLWSELEQSGLAPANFEVLIVDALGILAELYGCADLAFVGGAVHYRVHNVLEPSCRGLPVAFGPKYHTSQEARRLLSRKLVKVVANETELQQWWSHWHHQDDLVDQQLLTEVQSLCGASDRILRIVAEFLEE